MSKLAIILAFAALAAGCGMSGPGVARVMPAPGPGIERETTYDSKWVNPREPDAISSLDQKQQLSVDISKRELGARSMDMDSKIGDTTVPAFEKRQHDRELARRKAWKARMGGLETIKDAEEKDSDSEEKPAKPRDNE